MAEAFRYQARWCRDLGSILYAELLERSAHEMIEPGPLRILEIGASAGLNLRWDHYRYEADGAGWGDPSSSVRLTGHHQGASPPFEIHANVAERRGCDLAPLDASSADDRVTLLSFMWP